MKHFLVDGSTIVDKCCVGINCEECSFCDELSDRWCNLRNFISNMPRFNAIPVPEDATYLEVYNLLDALRLSIRDKVTSSETSSSPCWDSKCDLSTILQEQLNDE